MLLTFFGLCFCATMEPIFPAGEFPSAGGEYVARMGPILTAAVSDLDSCVHAKTFNMGATTQIGSSTSSNSA